MAGLYFEEFKPGMVIEHAIRRTVTETDNILFSAMTYNCAPLHIDAEYSAKTMYGQRLVNSMFLLALVAGITVYETTLGTTLGNLGFGAALWWNTLNAEAILHPESPVMNSNSPRIQVFFAVLVLLSLLFGAQLAALLHRSGEEKPVALKRATQKDFTAKKRRARRKTRRKNEFKSSSRFLCDLRFFAVRFCVNYNISITNCSNATNR